MHNGAGVRSLPTARLTTLRHLVRRTRPGLHPNNLPDSPWAGLRPAAPAGVPIIGHSRYENLLFNVGHGALGFTLAAGSAARITKLIDQAHPEGIQKGEHRSSKHAVLFSWQQVRQQPVLRHPPQQMRN